VTRLPSKDIARGKQAASTQLGSKASLGKQFAKNLHEASALINFCDQLSYT